MTIALSILYILHYVVARTLYEGARTIGIPPWLLLAIAIAILAGRPLIKRLWRSVR